MKFPAYLTFRNVLIVAFSLFALGVWLQLAWWFYVIVFLIALTISYFGTTQIRSNFHVQAFCLSESHPRKEIAISFDDGVSDAKQSNLVLDVLKEYQVPATFFCIGKELEQAAQVEVLKRMDREGHLVGNHSYSHSYVFDFYSSKRVLEELHQTDTIIQKHIGKTPLFFRPPYGITNPNIAKALRSTEHSTIGWSLRSLDTVLKEEHALFERVTKRLKAGDILLFHDHLECMPAFLKLFLEYVLKEGYTIVGVDELLQLKAYQ